MNVILAIFQLEKLGGRERDCIALGLFLQERGHNVTIVTTSHPLGKFAPLSITRIPTSGFRNHTRVSRFAESVLGYRNKRPNSIVLTFERMGGADFWFAAERAIHKTKFLSWMPRHRARLGLERDVFSSKFGTRIFFLTEKQRGEYAEKYKLREREHFLLPTIIHKERSYISKQLPNRSKVRSLIGVSDDAHLAISVCLNPLLKGVDRTLEALTHHPNLHFLFVGQKHSWVNRRARRLNLWDRVHIMPYQDDVIPLMQAADFLIHPAREEAAGQVIVESILAGTPVIATSVCGYASEIERLRVGYILPEPFRSSDLSAAISSITASKNELRDATLRGASEMQSLADSWLYFIADKTLKSLESI